MRSLRLFGTICIKNKETILHRFKISKFGTTTIGDGAMVDFKLETYVTSMCLLGGKIRELRKIWTLSTFL